MLGRLMGKALLQGCPIRNVKLEDHLYQYLCGYPFHFDDLKVHDPSLHTSLEYLNGLTERLLAEFLDMTEMFFVLPRTTSTGATEEIVLVPNGATKRVTVHNFAEFKESCFRYCLLGRIRPQLQALVEGFLDVMPDPTIPQMLTPKELMFCIRGFPDLSIEEWQQFTTYGGIFGQLGFEHPHVQWFWQAVGEMSDMDRVLLIQYVTGAKQEDILERGLEVFRGGLNRKPFLLLGISDSKPRGR